VPLVVPDRTAFFLTTAGSLLERRDASALQAVVTENWSRDDLLGFARDAVPAVARTAAGCLGVVGSMEDCPALVPLLGHKDDTVAAAAEDALWCIWFRAGSATAIEQVSLALDHIRSGRTGQGVRLLRTLTRVEPAYAEAHHQLGLAHHAADELDAAERAYRNAVELNRYHFAAMCGLGHVAAQRGDLREALDWYRRALTIHPRLAEIREIVPLLAAAVSRRDVA